MKRLNFREQIVDELGQKIVNGTFAIGETLSTEMELAEQYGVSRPVIREAIKSLAARGLIVSRSKVGTKVAPYDQWKLLDPSVILWTIQTPNSSSHFMLKLAELGFITEPAIAGWVAEYATSEDRDLIGEAFRALEMSYGHKQQWLVADNNFHAAIIGASKNEFLISLAVSVAPAIEYSRKRTIDLLADAQRPDDIELYEAMTEEALQRHEAVWLAIRDHDPHGARNAMSILMQSVIHFLQDLIRN